MKKSDVLVIFDEAEGLPADMWDQAEAWYITSCKVPIIAEVPQFECTDPVGKTL